MAGEHPELLIVNVVDVDVDLDDAALERIRSWVADTSADTAVLLRVERPGGAMLKPAVVVENDDLRDVSEDWIAFDNADLSAGLHASVAGESVSVSIADKEPALSLRFATFTPIGLAGDDPKPDRRYRCVTENWSFDVAGDDPAQCPNDPTHFIEAS